MITTRFIGNILYYFDELGYRIKSTPNKEDFEKAAEWTLVHTAELSDAILAVKMYRYCLDKWNKIEKMFLCKSDILSYCKYTGRTNINVISDDDACGTYFVTNGINKKRLKDIFIASNSFYDADGDNHNLCFGTIRKRDGYAIFEDGEYRIQETITHHKTMNLLDLKDRRVAKIVLSEDCGIFLKNNNSPYEIVLYKGFIGIYHKNYIEQLKSPENADTDQLVAGIEWDLLGKREKAAVAKVTFFQDEDIEMILLFAASTFLLFNRYMKSQKISTIFDFLIAHRIKNM